MPEEEKGGTEGPGRVAVEDTKMYTRADLTCWEREPATTRTERSEPVNEVVYDFNKNDTTVMP